MLEALGKPSSIVPFMIPERLARTPGSQKLTEMDGSGPFIFARICGCWRCDGAGPQPEYVPRPEPADFLSGGKKVNIDRLTLKVIPDPATQVEALQSGEIDYLQYVPFDWLPACPAITS